MVVLKGGVSSPQQHASYWHC